MIGIGFRRCPKCKGYMTPFPSDVIEQMLLYLTEYENMKIAESWDKYPEEMGR